MCCDCVADCCNNCSGGKKLKEKMFLFGLVCILLATSVSATYGGYHYCRHVVDPCIDRYIERMDWSDVCPEGEEVTNVFNEYSSSGGGIGSWDVWVEVTGNGSNKYEYETIEQYFDERYQTQLDALVVEDERQWTWFNGIINGIQKYVGWI